MTETSRRIPCCYCRLAFFVVEWGDSNTNKVKKIYFFGLVLGAFFLALIQGGFFSYASLVPDILTEISEPTHLEIESGVVLVNGVEVRDGTVLREGDQIDVGPNARADIVFFDNSVSRLASGTQVTITEMLGEDSGKTASHVELSLSLGEIWSKVTKLVNSESTFEVTTADVAAAVRGSAFNVAVQEDGNTAVMAVEHSLSLEKVRATDNEKEESIVIVEGQKASSSPRVRRAVSTPGSADLVESVRFKIERIAESEKETEWFRANEQADAIQEVKIRRKIEHAQDELIGALPGELGYEIKSLRDQFFLTLAIQPEKKAEVASKIAERKIIEAQVLLRRGDDDEAGIQLAEAEELILRLTEARDSSDDAQTRAQIDDALARSINNSKQTTNSITAVNRDYGAKEFVYDVEVTAAPPEEKEEVKKEQYQYRIIEAYDLAKSGENSSAKKVVRRLAEDIQSEVTETPAEERIPDDDLNEIIVDPYLQAVIQSIEKVESQQAQLGDAEGQTVQRGGHAAAGEHEIRPEDTGEAEMDIDDLLLHLLATEDDGSVSSILTDEDEREEVSEQAVILRNVDNTTEDADEEDIYNEVRPTIIDSDDVDVLEIIEPQIQTGQPVTITDQNAGSGGAPVVTDSSNSNIVDVGQPVVIVPDDQDDVVTDTPVVVTTPNVPTTPGSTPVVTVSEPDEVQPTSSTPTGTPNLVPDASTSGSGTSTQPVITNLGGSTGASTDQNAVQPGQTQSGTSGSANPDDFSVTLSEIGSTGDNQSGGGSTHVPPETPISGAPLEIVYSLIEDEEDEADSLESPAEEWLRERATELEGEEETPSASSAEGDSDDQYFYGDVNNQEVEIGDNPDPNSSQYDPAIQQQAEEELREEAGAN